MKPANVKVTAGGIVKLLVTADGRKFLIAAVPSSESGAPSDRITVVLNWQAGLKK